MIDLLFKQGILKEEKIKFALALGVYLITQLSLLIIIFLDNEWSKYLILYLLISFLPTFLMLFLSLRNLEWYHVYDDRIEVKCLFGEKNKVFYSDIIYVEEIDINLTSRGMVRQFYIFNDGRKNNNNIFDINSCYNKKRFNLRIYKTAELQNYVVNTIGLNVK